MDKYLVSEIPGNQQVVIDVPEGYLRVAGYVDQDTGDGRMVFTRATKFAETGSEVSYDKDNIPLMQMHIQTPERAMVIAHAFMQLAESMQEWADDAECSDNCEECNCNDCPVRDQCFAEDAEDAEEDAFMRNREGGRENG